MKKIIIATIAAATLAGCAGGNTQSACGNEGIQAMQIAGDALNGISKQDHYNQRKGYLGMHPHDYWGLVLDVYDRVGDRRAYVKRHVVTHSRNIRSTVHSSYAGQTYSTTVNTNIPATYRSSGEVTKAHDIKQEIFTQVNNDCKARGPAKKRFGI